ncbi:MAG: hypothetical protein HOH43_27240 [Candidatus Latescibacteria bacterium]|nr:hypothetical protein [Candidatus Latescibacterota bacterium]
MSLQREFRSELRSQRPYREIAGIRIAPSVVKLSTTLIRASRTQRPNVDQYGRYTFNKGSNFGHSIELGLTLNDRVLLYVSPAALIDDSGSKIHMEQWRVQTRLLGFDAEVGRSTASWGPGVRGNFVVGANAPPTTMFRLSRQGGSLNGALLVSRDSDHDPSVAPGTMVAAHLDWTIRKRLTIGATVASIVSQFSPSEIVAPNLDNSNDNRLTELTASLYLSPTIKVYGVTAGDDFFRENFPKRLMPWGRRSAYMAGVYLSDLIGEGSTSLRVEYARLKEELFGEDWYVHRRFDYIRRGWILGHPMGRHLASGFQRTRERDLYVRISHQWNSRFHFGLTYDKQTSDVRQPLPISGIANPYIDLDDAVSFVGADARYHHGRHWILTARATWFGVLQIAKVNRSTWVTDQDHIFRVGVGYSLP